MLGCGFTNMKPVIKTKMLTNLELNFWVPYTAASECYSLYCKCLEPTNHKYGVDKVTQTYIMIQFSISVYN